MSIKILNPGLFSTVQDLGRVGYQDQGFSTAGAIDTYALRIGYTLIGNNGPAIEFTIVGPTIQFLTDNTFVLTGGHFEATLNNQVISSQTVIFVKKGDELKIGSVVDGARGYILFGKPLDIQKVANSYSTHTRSKIGGYKGRALKSNDVITCQQNNMYAERIGLSCPVEAINQQVIHIIEGPQIESFSNEAKQKLVNEGFKISEKSDRMGFRLQGEKIAPIESADIISEPVALGSIQVPNDGNPIILLNDKQTVGGYTKIATVCAADLSLIAQKQPNETVKFEWITVEAATEKLHQKERELNEKQNQVLKAPIFDTSQMRKTSTRINKLLKGE
ncbi:biotin-dependent carboxyltransferase family protein [Staphylococcus xylosus]|uniref:5-oxoprolinase subunit C family protein n=1 Tax=Staphylococcus xylosus TaxID=1288 RepID=UPI0004F8BED9|nr:biotin-dependent carboxyltransferase family protein [Staphylococcus xylosus]MBG3873063.1 biotin-dependent carboxyltransferase family protein [Staphylococcus xylosus]MCA2500179.1 biotin-dependent carboxyltransferase family protein [Staphylococcus xylosus]MCA2502483.1 biotin-dependent carboxyltransferase family protein [Staphylococcus xylosus]MCE7779889.1 biotin-dependent carboxyltransferase family protein [Staphylococcus xylosus]MDW8553949.1 biotin-dependent carboxyltransferase family protei